MDNRQESTYMGAVMSVQRFLRQIEHEGDGTNLIPVDGIYGADTKDAVIRFQKRNGLSPTGIVNEETWEKLFEEYEDSLERNSSANGIYPFFDEPDDFILREGDSNSLVAILEIMLDEIFSDYTGINGSYNKNGVYDKDKSKIISEYQKNNLLPENGNVDKATWNRLADDYNSAVRKEK